MSVTLVGVPSAVVSGASLTVSAQVQGATSTAVTWTVDSVTNGNASVGTISGSGNTATYTAPASAGSHVLAAISVADPNVSGSAQVTVLTAGPVITAVTASSITQTSAAVSWTLNEPGTGQVFYGLTASYGSTTTPELSFNYSAHLQTVTGLTAGTLYHYCVKSADQAGNLTASGDYTFTTAAATTSSATSSITSVSVSPTTLTLNPSAQSSFAATVAGTGTYSYGVTWSCLLGTITSGGLYTAPSTAGNDTVTATSVQDGTRKGTSSVTVSSSGSVSGSVPAGTSVKSSPYNAYGDGVHDDTAAINTCIAAVAGTGGTVVVPAGTYMVNPTANSWRGLMMGSNMTLYLSAGAVIQSITMNVGSYAIIGFANCSNCILTGPGIISGDRATHGGPVDEQGHGVYVNVGTHDITISNITSQNCYGDGFYIYSDVNPSHITITNVTANNNRRQGISIIGCQGGFTGSVANGCTVTGSTFQNTNGTGPECGLDIEPNGGEIVDGVLFQNNTLQGNYGGGITVTGATGSTTTNVIIDSNTVTNNVWRSGWAGSRAGNDNDQCGIEVAQNYGTTSLSSGTKITNNTITGSAGLGISCDHATYATITGNKVSGSLNESTYANGSGAALFDSDYNTITGNTITGNAGGGVWFVGTAAADTHNTIAPNTFSGNGGANYPAPTY